jgi:hypothetical protein
MESPLYTLRTNVPTVWMTRRVPALRHRLGHSLAATAESNYPEVPAWVHLLPRNCGPVILGRLDGRMRPSPHEWWWFRRNPREE